MSIPEDFTSIRFHPDSERVAYASGSGAYRTSDGGLTWNELANSPYTYDVLIDPVHPSVIYAAVHGKPFVVSTSNLGVTWDTLAPRGLGSAAAATLAMTPQTNMLLTGGDGGLWWFDPTPVGVREPAQPATISLAQNAPNPAVDATTISFTMAQRGEVDLRVYDMLGREIAAPLRASLSAGEHHAVVRTSSLRVGTYAYVLRVNGSTMTRTMIVAR